MVLKGTICWSGHLQIDHLAGWSATIWMHIKFSILNLSKYIYLNIFFYFNHVVWCRWNIKRTWDMTTQRDLQFYRNELEVHDYFGIIWEPYTDKILHNLPMVCREGSHYGGPRFHWSILRLWRCMFQTESSVTLGLCSLFLMSSTNWLG